MGIALYDNEMVISSSVIGSLLQITQNSEVCARKSRNEAIIGGNLKDSSIASCSAFDSCKTSITDMYTYNVELQATSC